MLTRQGKRFRVRRPPSGRQRPAGSGRAARCRHPAVASLLRGEAFTGKARMLGRDFMTHYQPIKDRDGQVVGAFFVGLDFSDGWWR